MWSNWSLILPKKKNNIIQLPDSYDQGIDDCIKALEDAEQKGIIIGRDIVDTPLAEEVRKARELRKEAIQLLETHLDDLKSARREAYPFIAPEREKDMTSITALVKELVSVIVSLNKPT